MGADEEYEIEDVTIEVCEITLLLVLLSIGACCLCTCLIFRKALSVVHGLQVNPPCRDGMHCKNQDVDHLAKFSHPYDMDYGFSVRVHGGPADFVTQRQCFNFMDPYRTGYVNEKAAFRDLMKIIKKGPSNSLALYADWKAMDTDGNGYVSFPEFVEWANTNPRGMRFMPHVVGIVGETSTTLPCAVDCPCLNYEGQTMFCVKCGHHRDAHYAPSHEQLKSSLPAEWTLSRDLRNGMWAPPPEGHSSFIVHARSAVFSFITGKETVEEKLDFLQVAAARTTVECNPDVLFQIQKLMDASVRQVWTRDRGKANKVPYGYEVVSVQRNENVKAWLKYVVKQALMKESIQAMAAKGNPIDLYEMRTSKIASELPMIASHPLRAEINEWYLWHGASMKAAHAITSGEFKQAFAGSATGTLYGRGTYLTDSCTKADEYAKEWSEGDKSGLFATLLCRVMGGNVNYNTEVEPDAVQLETSVFQREYDSVLGDREKLRDTFKEIVIYESAQAYPEYIVFYKRKYDDDAASASSRTPKFSSLLGTAEDGIELTERILVP